MSDSEQKHVLIVDDELKITDSLVTVFAMAGYKSHGAYSAEEARATLQNLCPDLAIIDVRLPQMNGIELAILLKAGYPACRLVLFSGRPEKR